MRNHCNPTFGTIVLSLLLSAAASAPAQEPTVSRVKVGETVEITHSHSWCWFPTIHQFRSGEILVSMALSPDQVNSESDVSAYCISKDGGQNWSRRYTMGQGANQDGAWSDVPDGTDTIWQLGSYPEPRQEGDAQHFLATITKFSRGGRYSTEDREVAINLRAPAAMAPAWLYDYRFDGKVPIPDTRFKTQLSGRPWGNIVQGRGGEWFCSAYFTAQSDAGHQASDRDVVLRSVDDGRTWTERGTIAALAGGDRPAWVGKEGFNEGSLALLPDGRLYAVYRTGSRDCTMGNGWSADGGKTWTAPASIGFAGVAPRIHRLSNGMLVLVTGRPGPVVLRFNPDGLGLKWSPPVTIYSEMSTRYADVAEIAPGKLLVVYDHVPYGWNEIPFADRDGRNVIYGTFVEMH